MPGRRGWAANLEAEPAFTFHLKNGVEADLPARATQVVDEAERRRIMAGLLDDLSSVSDRSPRPRGLGRRLAALRGRVRLSRAFPDGRGAAYADTA